MIIDFGKVHKGKSVELVMIKNPEYVKWVLYLPNPSRKSLTVWWCDECQPDEFGILSGKIYIIETYLDALNHVKHYCKERRSDYRFLIKAIA